MISLSFQSAQLHRGQVHGSYYNYDWDRLHGDLDREGLKTPFEVRPMEGVEGGGYLSNGHHRAVAAMERGMMFVPHKEVVKHHPDPGYRDTKASTQARKPHWFTGNQRTQRTIAPKQIPGQGQMF